MEQFANFFPCLQIISNVENLGFVFFRVISVLYLLSKYSTYSVWEIIAKGTKVNL
jgi:hypothetical protein